MAGARVRAPEGGEFPEVISLVVPPTNYQVEDDWFTLDLKATGSKTVVLQDVFVPTPHIQDQRLLALGYSSAGYVHTTALYTMPSLMVMACFPAATILGVAEQMFEDFLEIARVRDDEYFAVSKALAPGLQLRAAESALDLKAALTLLREVAARMDHFVFDVVRPSLKEKAEIRYALAYIVQKARTAAGRLYDAAGANAT